MIKTRYYNLLGNSNYKPALVLENDDQSCQLLDRSKRNCIKIGDQMFIKCWQFSKSSCYIVYNLNTNEYNILKEVSKDIGKVLTYLYILLDENGDNDFVSIPKFTRKYKKKDIFIYPYNGNSLENYINIFRSTGDSIKFIDCLQIFNNILKGVKCFHNNHIAHCDLKPANISYDQKHDLVQIIDHDTIYQKGMGKTGLVYSKHFESPEIVQVINSGSLGGIKYFLNMDFYKNDMWALGVIWYNLVTSKMPYRNQFYKINGTTGIILNEKFVQLVNNQNIDMNDLRHLTEDERFLFLQLFLGLCTKNPGDRLDIDEAIEKLKEIIDIYLAF